MVGSSVFGRFAEDADDDADAGAEDAEDEDADAEDADDADADSSEWSFLSIAARHFTTQRVR